MAANEQGAKLKANHPSPEEGQRICSICHSKLPKDIPEIFCPTCALRSALNQGQPGRGRRIGRVWNSIVAGWQGLFNSRRSLSPDEPDLHFRRADRTRSSPAKAIVPQLHPGDTIGDYEILESVGGHMALVFKAKHLHLHKMVALKLLPQDWTKDPNRVARFQREIQVMGRLDHPNLVRAMDARELNAFRLIAMEWVEGMDLGRLLKTQGRLAISDACEMVRQAAVGLQHAHDHGLIHRDIKPSNLMMTPPGILKIIDLGLALSQEESSHSLTQSGALMGTMSFCAPEQIRNPSKVDLRADLYSLGCTLYKLLTGKAPYGSCQTMAEVVHAHLEEPFPRLCEIRRDAPAEVEAVLLRMTQKDPAARYSTAKEVADALAPFAVGADLISLMASHSAPAPLTPTSSKPVSLGKASLSETRPTGGLLSRRWILGGLLVMLLAGGVAVWKGSLPNPFRSPVPSQSHGPVLVLMDTIAPRGIYGEENKKIGRSNAMDLYELFKHQIPEIPPANIHPEAIGLEGENRSRIRSRNPHLILIHRSVFFHSMAAALGIRYREDWRNEQDRHQFETAYKILGDRVLREFIWDIGNSLPQTKFLIYSRGTDTNWISTKFRADWVKEIEDDYPVLKSRVQTMLIEGGMRGTWDDPPTNRVHILQLVRKNLGLPPKE